MQETNNPLGAQAMYRLIECRHGLMLVNPQDHYIGRSLIEYGEYCQGEIDLFAQFVQTGDVIFEVGANIGPHSVWFADRIGSSGCLYAFEPQRLVFQMLCANMAINSLTSALCIQGGLGSKPSRVAAQELDPTEANNFGSYSLLGSSASGDDLVGDSIEISTLDSYQVPSCKLIKIDVEGMEHEVIAGGKRFIAKHQPVLFVENDRPALAQSLVDLIASLDYKMFWYTTPLFNPNNFRAKKENLFIQEGGLHEWSLNMICIHQDDKRYGLDNHFAQIHPGKQFVFPPQFKF